ncbi:unnamed protein product [Cunninghamella blakesleeana]
MLKKLLSVLAFLQFFNIIYCQDYVYGCMVDKDTRTCIKGLAYASNCVNCFFGGNCGACRDVKSYFSTWCIDELHGSVLRYDYTESNSGICQNWRNA